MPINSPIQNKGHLVPSIVLASASDTRRRMLETAGISLDVLPVRIDEEAIRAALEAEGASPRDIADALGEFKARKGHEKSEDAVVIGSDQVLAVGGSVLGKAASREQAAEHLSRLQGRRHQLLSSAVIYHEGAPVWRTVGTAHLTMHALTEGEIAAYLDRAWPDVSASVGAYKAEGLGARLFARIDGDWFTVLGLPLLEVLSFLRLRGWLD